MFTREQARILKDRTLSVLERIRDNPTDTNIERAVTEIGLALIEVIDALYSVCP